MENEESRRAIGVLSGNISQRTRGSEWRRWDLHFHTPASYDYTNKSITPEQLVTGLVEQGISVVAITDHHRMDVGLINRMQELGKDKLTVLPGIEFCSELGGSEPVHFIGIFPESTDVTELWKKLSVKANITEKEVEEKGYQNVYCEFVKTCELVHELGGIVSVHAGKKSNTIEGLKSGDYIKRIIKKDLVRDCIDIYEVGRVSDVEMYRKDVFPHLDSPLPLILCSDNHDVLNYQSGSPLWIKADPTFRGLLMILLEPDDRVQLAEWPEERIRVDGNKTKYVKSITFNRKASSPHGEKWFEGGVAFNSGLVAIIGNKGSGKSALADSLGLLGASKNSDGFSFLSTNRFKHPKGGRAQHFEATLEWESGHKDTLSLSDLAQIGSVERLKYLPQDHVEKVCNELINLGEEGFEKELKSVIFSHVPLAQRLGQTSLDDLVRFQTGEKQKRIDGLVKELREVSRERGRLEAALNPVVRRGYEEKLQARKIEIDAHDKSKPQEIKNPADDKSAVPVDPELLKSVQDCEGAIASLTEQIAKVGGDLSVLQRRRAIAERVVEKLGNIRKEFVTFVPTLEADAKELGLQVPDLVTLTINTSPVTTIKKQAEGEIVLLNAKLDEANPESLSSKISGERNKLKALHAKLSAPNQAYQAYLKQLADWQAKKDKLVGSKSDVESQKGLEEAIADLDRLPGEIEAKTSEQLRIAHEIQIVKVAQADVYRTLYHPVQGFISTHPLAKDKLKLEFRAELVQHDVAERILSLIAQNKRGSFMGVDEGKAKLRSLVQIVNWEDSESVEGFLRGVDKALHEDQRSEPPVPTLLNDQLAKGRKAEELLEQLYSMDYLKPRYVLRWDGKDLEMLSPGERGTLLLVFYLLIDQSDVPLVIDQPEGNLDNHTVAKVLVDCIREARKRRQVFIVTHNPNLAVVCDADQIIHANINKLDGNLITYTTGALENPEMIDYVTDVLEGTRWAFGVRGDKYEASGDGISK